MREGSRAAVRESDSLGSEKKGCFSVKGEYMAGTPQRDGGVRGSGCSQEAAGPGTQSLGKRPNFTITEMVTLPQSPSRAGPSISLL